MKDMFRFRALRSAALLLAFATLWGQELRVDQFVYAPGGAAIVRYRSDPQSYHVLRRGESVTEIRTSVQLKLGEPGTAEMQDWSPPPGGAFYQLEQHAVAAPADTDQDGIDDVYELAREAILDPLDPTDAARDPDGDGRSNLRESRDGTDPEVADQVEPRLTTVSSSPGHGESDVAVTRETILRFSQPLAFDTLLGPATLRASFGGRDLLTRRELSADRRIATLFYLEPLPGSARIRVALDGNRLRDESGQVVDADGDGVPGGVGWIEFDTLSLTPVGNTAVVGRVFASELVAGQAVNTPLAGVAITVDGAEETLRAVTDGLGNFRLQPAPAGTFFVHVDGRTSPASQWPNGAYYPFVGKAWDAVAGKQDNLAGGTGEIYLPLVRAGSLQPVSATQETRVEFPAEVVTANPALAGVSITIPANALYADDGTRGGRVGIAPVPPDRLPEPLPAGLNFPLVITVQTDGGANFDRPVPVVFPNLPDPVTGQKLPPGAKSALWSFDHDLGSWVINGPMTVSADGNFVVSDPGVGIREPGWHGTQPGTSVEGGEIEAECEPTGCVMGPIRVSRLGGGRFRFEVEPAESTPGILNWFAGSASNAQALSGGLVEFVFCAPGPHTVLAQLSPKCGDPCSKTVSITVTDEEINACDPGELSLTIPGQGFNVGETVTLGLLGLSGPIQGEVEWTIPGATPSSGRGLPFNTRFCQPGDFEISWKVTTPCGTECTGVATVPVVGTAGCSLEPLLPLDTLETVVGEAFSCVSEAGQEGEVEWTADGGTLLLDRVQSVGRRGIAGFGVTQSIIFCTPGTKTVRARLTTACGQVCEQTVNVTVRGEAGCSLEPLHTFETTTISQGEEVNLITSTRQAGTVVWTAEGGTLLLDATQKVGTSGVAGFGTAQTIRFCTPGTKVITATLTTECGVTCQQSATITVTENPCNFSPFSNPGTSTIPAGDAINLATLAAVEGTFRWEAPGGELLLDAIQKVGLTGVAGFGTAQTIVYPQPGNYVVRGVLETSCGQECSREYAVTVTAAAPTADPRSPAPLSTTLLRLLAGSPSLPSEAAEAPSAPLIQGSFDQPAALVGRPSLANEPAVVRQTGLHYYVLVNRATGAVIQRGFAGRNGVAHPRPLIAGANRNLREIILQADSFWMASQDFRTGENGSSLTLAPFRLAPPPPADTDQDGLPDEAEFVVGTDPNDADSDDDGIDDAEETRAGTAFSEFLGVIASVPTPGHAVDVAAEGDLLALALKSGGLAVFNIFSGLTPAMVAQVPLPGEVSAVAVDGATVAAGCGQAGLALVDVSVPAAASIRAQLNLGAPVRSVAARAGLAYAGLDSGAIVLVDLATGTESGRVNLGNPIQDLALTGDFLYALTASELAVIAVANGGLELRQTVSASGSIGAGGRRLRLFAGGGLAYAVDTQGFRVFDLAIPDQPVPLIRQDTAQFGWKQLAPTGTGVALAAVGANSTDDGDHEVSLYDLEPGGTNAFFSQTFTTPGLAEAVTIASGLGYVADGPAGLQVVRFLPRDTRRRAPTITLASPFATGQAEENQPSTFTARVADDVQVGRVEFFLDGRLVDTDSSFPFELRVTTPARTAEKDSFTLLARAVDTGGNSAFSDELRLELTDDATPPAIARVSPSGGTLTDNGPVSRVAVGFSEAIQPDSLPRERLGVTHAGGDGQFGTADDLAIVGGTLTYRSETFTALLVFESLLAQGNVRVTLAPGVTDLGGNARSEPFTWSFSVGGPRVVATTPANGGTSGGDGVAATFNGPIVPGTLEGRLTVVAAGPDGRFNTADDAGVPGGGLLYDLESNTATLRFAERLGPGEYRAEIGADVADAAGNTLGAPARWEFTVVAGEVTAQSPFTAIVTLSGFGNTSELRVHLPAGVPVAWFAPLDFGACASWSLYDPIGRPMFQDVNLCASPVVVTTLVAGDYTVRAVSTSGSGGRSRLTVSVHQRRTFEANLTGQDALEQSSGARVVGDVDVWELILPAGERFAFDLTGLGSASWTLRDLAGRVLFEDELGNELAVPDTRAGGLFRIEIAARSTSGYELKLTRTQTRRFAIDLRGATHFDSHNDLPGGNAIQRVPGDVDLIEFTIQPGDRWVFIPSSSFPCFDWSLRNPVGLPGFGPLSYCNGSQTADTRAGGVFTLRLTPSGGETGGYSFRAVKVLEQVFEVDLLTATRFEGQGNLAVPGSRDRYRLQINAGDDFRFVAPRFGNCLPWELRDPQDRILFASSACDGSERPDLSAGGVYELRVTADDGHTGPYSFIIAKPVTTRFEHDLAGQTTVSFQEDLAVPGSVHVHELRVQPGDQFFVNVAASFGGGGSFQAGLASPRGGGPELAAGEEESGVLWSLVEDGGAVVVAERPALQGDIFVNFQRGGNYLLTLTTTSAPPTTAYFAQLNRVRSGPGRWLPVPANGAPTGPTTAVVVRGDDVFVAGQFESGRGVALLSSGAWTFLGAATRGENSEGEVFALLTDGTHLFAGGNFTAIQGVPARGVARWNGTTWEALAEGIDTSTAAGFNFEVRALALFNDELFAGGRFRQAGTVEAKNLARWNGGAWLACPLTFPFSGLTQGIGGRPANDTSEVVRALAIAQGELWIGGEFQFPGRNLAKWNGAGIDGGPGLTQSAFDGGTILGLTTRGTNLFAVGRFTRPDFGGALNSQGVARWDGAQWNGVGDGASGEPSVVVASGSLLFVGGNIGAGGSPDQSGSPANGVARFDGTGWSTLEAGVLIDTGSGLLRGQVTGLAVADSRLFLAGQFQIAGGEAAPHFAIWEETP